MISLITTVAAAGTLLAVQVTVLVRRADSIGAPKRSSPCTTNSFVPVLTTTRAVHDVTLVQVTGNGTPLMTMSRTFTGAVPESRTKLLLVLRAAGVLTAKFAATVARRPTQ